MNTKISNTRRHVIVPMFLVLLLSACQTTGINTGEFLKRDGAPINVMLMPMDVELSELSAGGVKSVRADWSENAKTHMEDEIRKYIAQQNAVVFQYEPQSDDPDPTSNEVQLLKLFQAVGGSVAANGYGDRSLLPSKAGVFDWTLGPTVQELKSTYDADYALFTFVRDSYATAGRAAVIVVGAILGVGIQGGVQYGYASLVDLKTGDIVWFNQLGRGGGDLRTPDRAAETVKLLLNEFPK